MVSTKTGLAMLTKAAGEKGDEVPGPPSDQLVDVEGGGEAVSDGGDDGSGEGRVVVIVVGGWGWLC